jgi:hypothetical protein
MAGSMNHHELGIGDCLGGRLGDQWRRVHGPTDMGIARHPVFTSKEPMVTLDPEAFRLAAYRELAQTGARRPRASPIRSAAR